MMVRKLHPDVSLPSRAHPTDAGADLRYYAADRARIAFMPGELKRLPTGLALSIPEGHAGLVVGRSGYSSSGLLVTTGVIDSGYTGEVMVMMQNVSPNVLFIAHGDRIAQLLVTPVITPIFEEVHASEETSRGSGGFGSTGV